MLCNKHDKHRRGKPSTTPMWGVKLSGTGTRRVRFSGQTGTHRRQCVPFLFMVMHTFRR